MLESVYKRTSYDILRGRIAAGFGVEEPEPVGFPDRHLVGIDGDPVPFHKGQELIFDSERRTLAMLAGTQSGKTSFGPWWLNREIDRCGPGDYLVVTSSFPLLKLKLLPSILEVFEGILGRGRFWVGDKVLELKNPHTGLFEAQHSTDNMWSRIILGSASAANVLESATAKAAWLDEAGQDEFTLSAYRAVNRRLSLTRGRQLITSTLYNLGWLKSHIIDEALAGGKAKSFDTERAQIKYTDNEKSDIALVQFDSTLNPVFSAREFEERKAKMPPDEFAMFYRGQVAKLRSMVYDCLDDDKIIGSYEIPSSWPIIMGVDPVGQMTAAVWIAWNPTLQRLELYQEHEGEYGKSLQRHGREILDLTDGRSYVAYCGQPSENQARLDIADGGLVVQAPPIGDMWAGISRVYELIKTGRLVIHDCCERTIADMQAMKRKKDKQTGLLTNQIENKSVWHLPDAVRYAIVGVSYESETVEQVTYNPVQIGY